MTKRPTLISIVLLGAGLWACNGGDTSGPVEEPFIITRIGMAGTASEATAVKVNRQEDADEAVDLAWRAAFDLDGGARPTSLAADDGGDRVLTLDVRGRSAASGEVSRVRVRVTLHD